MQGEQWRSKPNKHGPYLQATHRKGSRRENRPDGEGNWREQSVVTSQFNLTNTVPLICRNITHSYKTDTALVRTKN